MPLRAEALAQSHCLAALEVGLSPTFRIPEPYRDLAGGREFLMPATQTDLHGRSGRGGRKAKS
jgi:hypothetical protein